MSTLVAALANPFVSRGGGHQAVPDEDDEENARARTVEPETARSSSRNDDNDNDDDDIDFSDIALEHNHEEDDMMEDDDEDDLEALAPSAPVILRTDRTLRDLEEERELARRRTSVCLLLGVFLLFRLWIEALTQADFGLLMLCLVGTSWCARYIRYNREREEELDRRIAAYSANNNNGENNNDRPDLRILSFQAQLALAIMESQRQMMQGGFGHPDGQAANTGVSDEARQQWERFKFKTVEGMETTNKPKAQYGTVSADEEEPSCTICLGEYEDGEELVQLPCEHIYHDECLTAWIAEHSKCPLCNMDLDVGSADESLQED